MTLKNIRHDIDPILVSEEIEKAVAKLEKRRIELFDQEMRNLAEYEQAKLEGKEKRWSKPPEGPAWIDPFIDGMIKRQREHFSKVRIIELPRNGERFILVYGNADDETVTRGTGPFESIQRAAYWFLNGGR